MQKKFISLLILSVFVLSIFSISIAAAAGSQCNLWCKIAYLFTGKIATTGHVSLSIAELAPVTQWSKTFGGSTNDAFYSVQQTSDGGYIMTGYTYTSGTADVWLVKTDSSGNQQWSNTFGGSNTDYGNSVRQTSDGGYIIVGYTYTSGVGYDSWLIKTDSSGNQVWNKNFGAYFLNSVQQTSDGGYITVGTNRQQPSGGSMVWLIKTDSSGNQVWNKTFTTTPYGTPSDRGYSVQQTSDGGYIITGFAGTGGGDAWLIKTDSSGNMQWNNTFGGSSSDLGQSVQQTSDGGYIIAGNTDSYGAGGGDAWLIKTDSSGNQQWSKTFGGSKYDTGLSVRQTSDGGYIMTGQTLSYGAGSYDAWVIKTDSSGSQQWMETFGGSSNDFGSSVQQTSDGGYIMAGNTWSFGAGSGDGWLVKLAYVCGNSACEPGENAVNCPADCAPQCGNKVKEGTEACDSDTVSCTTPQGYSGTKTCLPDCSDYGVCMTTQYCGDGIRNNGEQCDDANSNNNDACKTDCTLNVCNDGFIHIGVEACDSDTVSCLTPQGYSGTKTCLLDCSGYDACSSTQYCGDGAINNGEQCDDANAVVPQTCGVGACQRTVPDTCVNCQNVACVPGTSLPEICNNIDDDCDGQIDEGLTRATTCGLGACVGNTGIETCSVGTWIGNTCNPFNGATAEVCDVQSVDEDCDGSANEGCACVNGATESCYEGAQGTNGVGLCHSGTKTCVSGQWGTCDGVVYPVDEICDNFDNDCDGSTDEENICCGNGVINTGEQCDGSNLNGKTCADFGMGGTGLKCTNCQFNKNDCYPAAPPACTETDTGIDYKNFGKATVTQYGQTLDTKSDVCINSTTLTEYYCSSNAIASTNKNCKDFSAVWSCIGGYCIIPEFTSIGAGIALIGSGIGYAFIRKKKK